MPNRSSRTLAIANDIYDGFTNMAFSSNGRLVATGSIDKVHQFSDSSSDLLQIPLS